ncbi:MAG: helix-turn-helix domain-containing protein [Planctomycetota bacterium]
MKRDASAFNNAVCERTKALRIELCGPRGRSELASMLGVTASTYHYYEKGRVLPADLLVKLCDLTNANVEWLLLGVGPKYRSRKGGDKRKETNKTGRRKK